MKVNRTKQETYVSDNFPDPPTAPERFRDRYPDHFVDQEQPWQALLDSAGEGIWGVDLAGRCTFVNRAALGMLGYEAADLVGCNMHEVVHHHYPDGRAYPSDECVVYGVFRRGITLSNHLDHVFRKDGSLFWVEMSAQPIVDHGVTRGAVVTFRDVTKARMAEEALRRSEKLAAVGQLASSIAHEINNPLEAVTNLLYLTRTAESLEEAQQFALSAENELARVTEIATQTLRFHRQQTAPALTDLGEMVRAVLGLHRSRFASRGVTAHLDMVEKAEAVLLEGDLRQVLNNLIRNAFEAMPKGGVLSVRLRAARSLEGEAGWRLTIADTGAGFLPKNREHLFEPFHTSKEATGTGLGLWISKGIVDKHRGTIRMRSRLQSEDATRHGTVFAIWLPMRMEAVGR